MNSKVSEQKVVESTEAQARPIRRTFSQEYKRQVLKEADACAHGGCVAASRGPVLVSS